MVFVFGIDVPLVELIFVLTLILAVLFGILVYLLINQIRLHKLLEKILGKEDMELKGLKEINQEEKNELKVLRGLKKELDKLLYGEQHLQKMVALIQPKKTKGKRLTAEEKRKIAKDFWNNLFTLSKKNKAKEILEILEQRKDRLDRNMNELIRERKKIEEFLVEIREKK